MEKLHAVNVIFKILQIFIIVYFTRNAWSNFILCWNSKFFSKAILQTKIEAKFLFNTFFLLLPHPFLPVPDSYIYSCILTYQLLYAPATMCCPAFVFVRRITITSSRVLEPPKINPVFYSVLCKPLPYLIHSKRFSVFLFA